MRENQGVQEKERASLGYTRDTSKEEEELYNERRDESRGE